MQHRIESALVSVARFRTTALSAALGAVVASVVLAAWSCQSVTQHRVNWTAVETSQDPDIRVRLERRARKTTIGGTDSMLVGVGGPDQGRPLPAPLRVTASEAGIRIIDRSGRSHSFPAGAPVDVRKPADEASAALQIGERTYPGLIRLVPRGSEEPSRYDIVNVTTVERYLPGVLAAELFGSWELEAFRAQAVAARSYAIAQRERARERGRWYDVDDHVGDQAYVGLTSVENAKLGAFATRGLVLIQDGGVTKAYYSSTCGGRPALASEVWPTQPGSYRIRSVADRDVSSDRESLCQDAPLYSWHVSRSRSALSDRIRAWGVEHKHKSIAAVGRLRSIDVIEKSDSGRPIRYELTGTNGKRAQIGAEHLRVACNAPVGGHASPGKKARVYSSDLRFRVGVRSVRIDGRGSGHGVGLCQYCASRMAKRGDEADEMLERFYPSSDVKRLY